MEMGNPLFLLSLSFIHMEIKKSAVGNVQITLKTERGNTKGKLEDVVRHTE